MREQAGFKTGEMRWVRNAHRNVLPLESKYPNLSHTQRLENILAWQRITGGGEREAMKTTRAFVDIPSPKGSRALAITRSKARLLESDFRSPLRILL